MIDRRVFLKSTGLAAVGLSMAPAFLQRTAVAAVPSTSSGKILVTIFQRGGADGLNIVVPHGDNFYYEHRPSIAIRRPDPQRPSVLDLDGFFGFFEMPEGAFRVQPFKEGWVFTPEMHDTFLNGLEVPNWLFFRGHRDGGGGGECVIEGRVSHPEGEGWGGVTLKLIGLDQIIATETGPDGGFRFGELPPGWYLVVAYHHELDFAPYVAVADLSGEQCFAEVNFNAWASEDLHRIYGVVYTFSDDGFGQNGLLPLWDTTVKAKLIDTNEVWETMTGDLGLFILHGLPEGGYLVSPHKEGWFFTPEVEDAHVNGLELPWPMFFTGHRGDI
ncbi:hypothetical protein IIA79_07380 [bacterium]|nr:hypothetical protein [bacterium]